MKHGRTRYAYVALITVLMYRGLLCYAQTEIKLQVASVVAERFETVVVSDSTFLLNIKLDNTREDSLVALRLPFVEMIAGLTALAPSAEADIEHYYTSLIVGANDFRMPRGLGIVGSRKCYVGVREDGAQPDLTNDFSHAGYESVGDRHVWMWALPPDEGDLKPTPLYASQIGSHYFLMTNNVEDFKVIAEALSTANPLSATMLSSFERDGVTKHQYWAYRVIKRDNLKCAEAAGLGRMNADVTSISFFADIAKREGFLRVLSSDASMKLKPKVLPDSDLTLQPRGGGVWEAAILLKQDRASLENVTMLFYSLGFWVAV